VQRLLGDRIHRVVDAMLPGGSGDPFDGLDTHEREELATLYRLGYPRGDEFMIAQPMGQIWLWTSMAERLVRNDPYFADFWTKPGFVGHDQPSAVSRDLIDARLTVGRALYAKELMEEAEFHGQEFEQLRNHAELFAGMHDMWDTPMAVQIDGLPEGYRLGAGVKVVTGSAAGRQLYCMAGAGNVLLCDGEGEASNLRFTGVIPGDEVHVDNHAFLAFCYFYRHHLMPHAEYQFLTVDGNPIYAQYELPEMSPFMGTCHTGRYEGKLMWVHHTHDASLWPPQGIGFKTNVEREWGADEAKARFRLRWTENAEHVPPEMAKSPPGRNNNTWLIDYQPVIEQCLADLAAWVEDGVEPVETNFDYRDGMIVLPPSAAERQGIQPVVAVTANGAARTEARVGEDVRLQVRAVVPPGAGTIIAAQWDFDGSGTYPEASAVDGSASDVTLEVTHRYERPGTYFATALVESHREGDVNAASRRIPNLASARVVVT
ncbi:MAG: PKD domain-containing protein, partial [Acidimicrobiales bacterium]